MSKAFTRESDDSPEERLSRAEPSGAPDFKNYLTLEGSRRLAAELEQLSSALVQGQPPESRPRAVQDRIAQLRRVLATAVVVEPTGHADRVRFGVTVTVRTESGDIDTYQIVGVDEADPGNDRVSWQSPIARALMGARVGDTVRLTLPAGPAVLEVIRIQDGEF